MASKAINLLAHTATFNKDIREWIQQTTNLKIGATFKIFSRQDHHEQRRAVTTLRKKEIYSGSTKNLRCTANPSRRASRGDRNLNTIVLVMQTHIYEMVKTDTRQCSPYQLQLSGHGKICTYECDDECHTGGTQEFVIGDNKCNKDQY